MNLNKVFKVEKLSKCQLIMWFRENISKEISTIEHLGTGSHFLLAIERIIPGSISLQKLNFQRNIESDRLRNFCILRKIFHKLGIDKEIEAEKMVKRHFKDNYNFALWFRAFFLANYKGSDKDPLNSVYALETRQQTMSAVVDEETGESVPQSDLPDIKQSGKMKESNTLSENHTECENEYQSALPIGTPTKGKQRENKNVREYYSWKHTSKHDVIKWFRSTLSPNLHLIEELGSGVEYCLGLEVLFPGLVPMNQVKFKNSTQSERINNFKVIGRVLDELGVEKSICLERLAKGMFKDNLQFAQWFMVFFLSNYRGQAYNTDEIRAAWMTKSKTRPKSTNDQNIRVSAKEVGLKNVGQGDFERRANKSKKIELAKADCRLSQGTKIDMSSQTEEPLQSLINEQTLLVDDSANRKLFKIRLSCNKYPENELSEIIINLLDEEDVIENEENNMENFILQRVGCEARGDAR